MPKKTHGQSQGGKFCAEYRAWKMMRRRCDWKNGKDWKDYGGRGIVVCSRWSSFENFFKDMGPRPSKNHSLDRKDFNGNYCPENCRWATVKEQAINKRTVPHLMINGITRPAFEWAKTNGIGRSTYSMRIHKGWNIKDAAFVPTRRV